MKINNQKIVSLITHDEWTVSRRLELAKKLSCSSIILYDEGLVGTREIRYHLFKDGAYTVTGMRNVNYNDVKIVCILGYIWSLAGSDVENLLGFYSKGVEDIMAHEEVLYIPIMSNVVADFDFDTAKDKGLDIRFNRKVGHYLVREYIPPKPWRELVNDSVLNRFEDYSHVLVIPGVPFTLESEEIDSEKIKFNLKLL